MPQTSSFSYQVLQLEHSGNPNLSGGLSHEPKALSPRAAAVMLADHVHYVGYSTDWDVWCSASILRKQRAPARRWGKQAVTHSNVFPPARTLPAVLLGIQIS